jgi:hypothetical protein
LYKDNDCVTCPSTCSSCSSGNCVTSTGSSNCRVYAAGSSWCNECYTGYYANGGVCTICNSRCTACTDYQICTSCAPGYSLIASYCCPPGCSSCTHTQCWSCFAGYNMVSGVCV